MSPIAQDRLTNVLVFFLCVRCYHLVLFNKVCHCRRQVGCVIQVPRFPSPIKLKYNIVENGVKHHKIKPRPNQAMIYPEFSPPIDDAYV